MQTSRSDLWVGLAALGMAGWLSACSSKSAGQPDAARDMTPVCGVPAAFAWTSTGPILAPQSDSTHDLLALKDPSLVYDGNLWRVFASTVDCWLARAGWQVRGSMMW